MQVLEPYTTCEVQRLARDSMIIHGPGPHACMTGHQYFFFSLSVSIETFANEYVAPFNSNTHYIK